MGATEEQMRLLSDAGVTHVSYILILYSMAFLLYLFVNILLHVYFVHAFPQEKDNNTEAESSKRPGILKRHSSTVINSLPLRQPRMPRHRGTDSQQIRDAEAFELQGLIDEEDEDQALAAKESTLPTANGHV